MSITEAEVLWFLRIIWPRRSQSFLRRTAFAESVFHDLRHSSASLLLANDVPMKQIQEWLGHSDISTTANIYSHLDYKSKLTSANVMDNVLTLPETEAVGWQTWFFAENHVQLWQIRKKKSPVIWAQSLNMTGFFGGGGSGIRTLAPGSPAYRISSVVR